jgi:cytochrome c oxidase subunit 1
MENNKIEFEMSDAAHVNPEVVTTHEVHHDEHHVHHHKESFITKYIFSQDHKTIGKQFLITGMIWAIIGGLFSVLFPSWKPYSENSRREE